MQLSTRKRPARPGPAALALVVYLAWFITTPQNHPRIGEFLVAIQFEKVIAACTLIAVVLQGRFPSLRYGLVCAVVALFAIMMLSFVTSPYGSLPRCQFWAENHWKKLAFFLLLVHGLRTLKELEFFQKWTVYVMLFYQLVSWKDFLLGGSYVWQQGLKRMGGAWSGGGAAANAWGSMNLFVLPYSVWLLRSAKTRRERAVGALSVALSALSISYSGTRGAMLVGVVYACALFPRQAFRFSTLATVLVSSVLFLTVAPDSLKDRYLEMFRVLSSNEEIGNKVAKDSAQGRINGLIDGIKLGLKRPVLGYGPDSSAVARHEVSVVTGTDLQLHNLLGQVFGELGICGLAASLCVLFMSLGELVKLGRLTRYGDSEADRLTYALCAPILQSILVYLLYGLFTHSVYDIRWLYALGCQTVLYSSYTRESRPARHICPP